MAMNSDDASNQLKARLAASAGSSGLNKSLRIENGVAKGPFNLVAAFAAGHHHGVREAGTELAQIRAERDAFREAIKAIAGQPLSSELDAEEQDNADYEGAYDSFIKNARVALKDMKKKNGAGNEQH